jgi:hypothetical protein
MGRKGSPRDVSDDGGTARDVEWAAVYLASDEARRVTARVHLVDAGMPATMQGGGAQAVVRPHWRENDRLLTVGEIMERGLFLQPHFGEAVILRDQRERKIPMSPSIQAEILRRFPPQNDKVRLED